MDTSDLLRLSMNGGTKIYDQVNVENDDLSDGRNQYGI
jgi:hypothetical protein